MMASYREAAFRAEGRTRSAARQFPMSLAATRAFEPNPAREKILRSVLWLMLALSCVSFIEPSPYEFFFFLLIPVSLFAGIALTRTTIFLFFMLFTIVLAQFFSLIPYIQHRVVGDGLTPSLYTIYTVYLYSSAVLFAVIFSHNSVERVTLAIRAYAYSTVFAGVWGILSFLNVGGLGDREPITGRVAGPFKDPNVLGSYCIMGVLFFVQALLLDKKRPVLNLAAASIAFVGGVFFSMSRGSIGAMMVELVFLLCITWATYGRQVRRRIVIGASMFILLASVGVGAIATDPEMLDNVTQRAKIEQEYDGGVTGRFGNQKRSINMLIERPFGFGPFRFPITFSLQPHNSYIGAFSDAGWIGGLAFLFMVLSTSFVGLRLALTRSPFQRAAQVVTPAALGFFLQALQIDIDHWRFVFLMIGAIWGMESARRGLIAGRYLVSPASPAPAQDYRDGAMATGTRSR